MKLIGALTSPYVRKVRIVMAEKKLDFQLILEDVWAGDEILKSNPLGKVPCLIMEGGEAVFDSRVIVEYLDTLSPVGKLIPASGRERVEVRTWEAMADGICDAAILARLEATWKGRHDDQRCQPWIDRQLSRVDAAVAAMSRGLGSKPWCCGNHFTLADIDSAMSVSDQEEVDTAHWLLQNEGLFVGSSSALNVAVAIHTAKRLAKHSG